MSDRPLYQERPNRRARARLEEPAVRIKDTPGGGVTKTSGMTSLGERNGDVRRAGWCPECKERLEECACENITPLEFE